MTTCVDKEAVSEPENKIRHGISPLENAALQAAFRRIDRNIRCTPAVPDATCHDDYSDSEYVDCPHDDVQISNT